MSSVETISSPLNPAQNFSAFVPGSIDSHGQATMETSSSSSTAPGIGNANHFGFGLGSGPTTKSRQKPRLVKLRKHGGKVRRAASGEIASGFNPFASCGTPGKGSMHMNKVNDSESPGDKCFVFGADGSSSATNTSAGNAPVTNLSDEEEFSTPIGDSGFGSESPKEHSNGKVGPDIPENIRQCSESTSCDAENGQKVDSGEKGSLKSDKVPVTAEEDFLRQNDRVKTSTSKSCKKFNSGQYPDGKTINDIDDFETNLLLKMKKLSISDPGNTGGKPGSFGINSSNTPAFIFGSLKVDADHKEGTTTSGACSFSSNGFHQTPNAADEKSTFHSETINTNNLTSTTFGTSTSFEEFNVPQWDQSSLKSSLFPEVSKTPAHVRRSRSTKDKRSKKVKEKLKPVEPNQCNQNDSVRIESQERLRSPGYCSPMDYSPYRGEKSSNQYPTESPLTSTEPCHAREYVNSSSINDFKEASTPEPSFSSAFGDAKAFTFSFTSQGKIPHKKLQDVKKYRRKVNNGLLKNNLSATLRNNQENQPVNTGQVKQESGSTFATHDVCEVWRLRGNQAYRNGDISKAEDCYTQGIKSSLSSDNSEQSVKPVALCYGNRAAARISLGRLREAISDCEMAASLDPSYIKVYMRAANCHLVLGELGLAVQYFSKYMESASSVCLDRRTTIESAEGLQQAQKVADCTNRAATFLGKKTPDAASDALGPIADALSISSCSEKLLQMKAEALFVIRHYKEVIKLCEDTLETAERNSVLAEHGGMTNVDGLGSKHQPLPIVWRWNMISKSHFYMGNLELALEILEKLQKVESSRDENHEECRDSPASLAATISELLRYKNAGNEAVRMGRYMEAVEQYTGALSRNVDSRPFAAICFCNRAAANQALVQIADAIADCSLAMALDENYTKAVSRSATLHEMIRDYDQAASDLQRLISILVKQSDEKKTSETSGDRASNRKELRQARQRLSMMEEKSKEDIALDFFLILGVKSSDTPADIKKAYHKAALRHHPDKAGKILVRSESEGPWLKEILEEVHKGADRLFKMIGEAYSVLSDQTKRSSYELDEELRRVRASNRSKGNRRSASGSSSPFQASPNRGYWRESDRTYRNTYHWW